MGGEHGREMRAARIRRALKRINAKKSVIDDVVSAVRSGRVTLTGLSAGARDLGITARSARKLMKNYNEIKIGDSYKRIRKRALEKEKAKKALNKAKAKSKSKGKIKKSKSRKIKVRV